MKNVSIIVPVYNAQNTIKRCCDSILHQTIADIELIIVNDGSTDNSLAICQEIKNNDHRVKLINIPNSGPANARNVGIQQARGEYIGFVDADDYIDKNMYKNLYIAATKDTSKSVDIAMCAFYEVRNAETNLVKQSVQAELPAGVILNNTEIITHLISKYYNGGMNGVGSLCNKIYRRTFLTENKLLIDISFVRAEDHWFNFECFIKCQSFIYLAEPMYSYIKDTVGSVMKSYRANQFELFLFERDKLKKSYDFNFAVDDEMNNRRLLFDTIEYFYLILKYEKMSAQKIIKITKNKELIHCAKTSTGMTTHQNILRLCIAYKLPYLCFFITKLLSYIHKLKHYK